MKSQPKIRATLLLCLCFLAHASVAQVKLPIRLQEAIDLSEKYPYDPVVATEAQVMYTFKFGTTDVAGVRAVEKSQETLTSLREGYTFEKYVSTDTHSKIIKSVSYQDKNLVATRHMDSEECISNFSMDIFDTDQEVCNYQLYFDEIGERKKYAITKEYDDLKFLTKALVLEFHPVQKKTITFDIPDWLQMDFIELNFDVIKFEKNDEELSSGVRRVTYTFADLPESYTPGAAPGKSYYEPQIVLVFKSHSKGRQTPLMATINDQYQWYKSLVDEVEVNNEDIKPLVDKILVGKNTEQEKIEAIFYWVQDNIRYIAFERGIMGFRPEPAHKVCSKRFGDCKGMANLTKSMLTIAGFDARLTWIGTNYISPAYNYSFPSLANDNHMICALFWNGKKYYLDGTESYVAFGDYATRIQGRKVLIEDGDNYIIDSIPVSASNINTTISSVDFTYNDEVLHGNGTMQFTGEEKRYVLQQYQYLRSNLKDGALKKFLQEGLSEIEVTDYTSTDFTDRKSDLKLNYNFDLKHHTVKTGDELYLNLEVKNDFRSFFIDSTRTIPIDLDHKRYIKSNVSLTIPEGYKVKLLPEGFSFSQDGLNINISFREEAGKVIYSKEITVEYRLISPEMIPQWNQAMMGLEKVYNHYVIMQKL